jgi:hypothetical protein
MKRLDFGASFSRVFDLYGKYAGPLLIWAAVFELVIALAFAIMTVSIVSGGVGIAILAAPLAIALSVIGSALVTGAYIVGLHDAETTGRFPPFGDVWPRVKNHLGAMIVTSLLAGIGIFFGFILLLVPGLVLLTWWAVFAPVVMLEDRSTSSALGRSRELVRGEGWTVFGLIIVVGIVTGIAGRIIDAIVGSILGGADSFVGAFGTEFVSGTLTMPISALLAVVMYEALRAGDAGEPPATGQWGAPQAPLAPPTAAPIAPPAGAPTAPPTTPPAPTDPPAGNNGPFL